MTHVTWRLTAKYRDQPRNPSLANRVWATFTFLAFIIYFTLGNDVSYHALINVYIH